ncbi:MAG: type III secretion system chaperone [Gammaproteobacteria bacterium]|nr:type III secretion system chaperone [Gammaproteobacteria bacterium]MCY4210770.1 type III secretion system chaperone [Gammaproteobacteria bacterium]MCY4283455.1 type III secretion system chaperone [Gammaproteobacteria bacterium]MCY4337190.1 type III secretion system chaperone [Gammaproteobacteria bacterium]
MKRYHAQSYLALLAADPELASAADPQLSLYFDAHRLDFTLTETSLYFSCELLHLDEAQLAVATSPANVLLALLLEGNCMGSGAGGCVFLLDATNALRLKGQALLSGLESEGLGALLEDFLNQIDYWRPQLAAFLSDADDASAPG